MCGIAGTVGPTAALAGEQAREIIKQMCDVIEHRGPDDWGFRVENLAESTLAIGMRRLSIIDVARGRQPISNEDGTVWIVFNGEIYNYRELREELIARGHRFATRSDTETIIHLYEEEGERCVERLRGMFSSPIWDSRDRSLTLARDRVGKKPAHYALADGALVFGSAITSPRATRRRGGAPTNMSGDCANCSPNRSASGSRAKSRWARSAPAESTRARSPR